MSYDPTLGRWISQDPIAFDGGDANLFRYVGNDPINFVDPSGLEKKPVGLSSLPGALGSISPPGPAGQEAQNIGAAIQNTFDNNWQLTIPKIPWLSTDQRVKGYYCYDWAYSFENAFNLESSGNYFTAEVEEASQGTGVHFWLKITSKQTGKSVYVDDGFSNGDFVHPRRPIPKGWQMGNPGDVPKESCGLPYAYSKTKPPAPSDPGTLPLTPW